MVRFCAKCGLKYNGKIPFIDNLCLKCYLEEHTLLSIRGDIILEVCKICNAIKHGSRWTGSGLSLLENIYTVLPSIITEKSRVLFENTKLHLQIPQNINYRFNVEVTVEVDFKGYRMTQRYTIPVRIKPTMCPTCQKRLSGAHKAILQIRSTESFTSPIRKFIHNYLRGLERNYWRDVVEIKDLKEGIDVKLLNFTTARALANRFRVDLGAIIKETHKLIGRKNGKRSTLMTISVRLPGVVPGDFILYEDSIYLVKDIRGGHIMIQSTISGETITIPITLIWQGRVRKVSYETPSDTLIYLAREGEIAYLVSKSNPQKTYTLPISKLPSSAREGCEVKVLLINGKPYVLEVL